MDIDRNFQISRIVISRGYSDKDVFRGEVHFKNKYSGAAMQIQVNEERTMQIIDIVSDLLVEGLNAQLADIRADAQMRLENHQAAERAKLLEQQRAVEDAEVDEEIPYGD